MYVLAKFCRTSTPLKAPVGPTVEAHSTRSRALSWHALCIA